MLLPWPQRLAEAARKRGIFLRLHKKGMSPMAIARKVGCSVATVCNALMKMGLREPKHHLDLTPELAESIKRWYAEGLSCEKISPKIGRDPERVRQILERLGVDRRSFVEAAAVDRKYPLKDTAFDVLTPESAYWVGFLMGDGNVGGPDHTVRVYLAEKDVEHLHLFRRFMCSMHPVKCFQRTPSFDRSRIKRPLSTYRYAEYRFHSKHVVTALAKWGVVENKTFIAAALNGAENSRDFWRGVVDADGTIGFFRQTVRQGSRVYRYMVPRFAVLGSAPLMRQFATWLRNSLHIDATIRKIARVYGVSFANQKAVAIVRALYKNARVSLPRKAVVARAMDAAGPASRTSSRDQIMEEFGS